MVHQNRLFHSLILQHNILFLLLIDTILNMVRPQIDQTVMYVFPCPDSFRLAGEYAELQIFCRLAAMDAILNAPDRSLL